MVDISIIIPFDGSVDRQQQFNWVYRKWLSKIDETMEIVVSAGDGLTPFSKSAAINMGYRQSRGSLLILTDADTWPSFDSIVYAINKFKNGLWQWAKPCQQFYRISKNETNNILNAGLSYEFDDVLENMCDSVESETNACLMVTRELFETVGGFDERFRGWGGEDEAMIKMLLAASGQWNETNFAAYHLWHPFNLSGVQLDYSNVWKGQAGTNGTILKEYKEIHKDGVFQNLAKKNKQRNNI